MMSTVDNIVLDDIGHDGQDESLYPVKERILDNWSYLFAWLGGCVSIGTFTLGSSMTHELNIIQALVAMFIGATVVAVGLVFNGKFSHKYGVPYTIQLRSAFGIKGSKLPGFIRGVPAIIWFGFQSWVGASAINMVSYSLFGYENQVLFFILFQIIQIALATTGFKGIKWLENIGSIFILLTLTYMFFSVIKKYGAVISSEIIDFKGSWGLPFWGGVTAFTGVNCTVLLNVGDYVRNYKQGTKPAITGLIYWAAILPITIFMGMIGLIVSTATGMANPIDVFSSAVDNQFLVIVTMIFIAAAQVTTNVLNNILPPSYVLMDTFKLPFKKSAIIVGLLSFATFPWKLISPESAAGLNLFVQAYSAFLGPIFAVLIVDYFFIKKETVNLRDLYDIEGPFKGVNWAAIIAIIVGAVVALVEVRLSWYASLPPTALTYYILMKKMPSSKVYW